MATKPRTGTSVQEAIRLFGKKDLRGAVAKLRAAGATVRLGAKDRADLEKLGRSVRRMLGRDDATLDRRSLLALERALQDLGVLGASPRGVRPTPASRTKQARPRNRSTARKAKARVGAKGAKKKVAKKKWRLVRVRGRKAGGRGGVTWKRVLVRAKKKVAKKKWRLVRVRDRKARGRGGHVTWKRVLVRAKKARAPSRPTGARTVSRARRPGDRRRASRRSTPTPTRRIAQADRIRRTPHMDIAPEALRPGTTFEVSIYVDQKAARAGEQAGDVVVEAGAEVDIMLIASAHFTINGSPLTTMRITEATRSDAQSKFCVTVLPKDKLPLDLPPSLKALFIFNHRPCGMVKRYVQIEEVAAGPSPAQPGRVELEEGGTPADLTVTVLTEDINDGRQFTCMVTCPWHEKYKVGTKEPWNLPQAAEEIVYSYMEGFTADGLSPSMRLDALVGAGRELYDASPKIFKQALWDLIDAEPASGCKLKKIAIVTQEPFIPWELMIPYRKKNGLDDAKRALGVEFSVGRWPTPDAISARQKIPLVDSFVIAPIYTTPLSFAADEAKLVADSFAGELIVPADYDGIRQQLAREGRTLVHFVCHGQDEETQNEAIARSGRTRNRAQIIRLEKGQNLVSTRLEGMRDVRKIFEQTKPFVFLNACEIGRTTPALVGVGGFAKVFIGLGARAVIAPIWSVKDSIAHEIADTFYKRVKAEPNTPFAEILRDLRGKAYEAAAEDTYAAYCFYGDPAASRA
jgi:hypothetical protein